MRNTIFLCGIFTYYKAKRIPNTFIRDLRTILKEDWSSITAMKYFHRNRILHSSWFITKHIFTSLQHAFENRLLKRVDLFQFPFCEESKKAFQNDELLPNSFPRLPVFQPQRLINIPLFFGCNHLPFCIE